MKEDQVKAMLAHARKYIRSAERNAEEGPEQATVAFDEARHAMEIAGKALFLRVTGNEVGKTHDLQKILPPEGLVPSGMDQRRFSRLMADHTKGAYGFFEDIDEEDVREVIAYSHTMVKAAEAWPTGGFHPARQGGT